MSAEEEAHAEQLRQSIENSKRNRSTTDAGTISFDQLLCFRGWGPDLEVCVKWKNSSYLHLSWLNLQDVEELGMMAKTRVKNFLERFAGQEPAALEDCFPQDYLEVDRIVAAQTMPRADGQGDAVHYLTKFLSLNYAETTWELPGDLGAPEKIEAFRRHHTPPRNGNANGRIPRHHLPPPELPLDQAHRPAPTTLDGLGPLRLAVVDTPAASRQWRHLVATHHYLGYTPFAGAQLRYLVHSPHGPVAALGFAASAWACAARDTHIGWNPPTRKHRLHLVVGNARFLILPHLRVPNLASHLLARATTALPTHWHTAYGYTPVLVETFVQTDRFTGASYRAANWIHVGQTQGRGKLDRTHRNALPVKDVYLYPLHRHYRRILATPD
jgi:hypothetical protein